MAKETQVKVYDFVKRQTKPVTVPDIKRGLKIVEPNVVEQAVLRNLNEGLFELTFEGLRISG